MRVLITGIAGFIGTHLATAHLAAGDEVDGVDDLSRPCGMVRPDGIRSFHSQPVASMVTGWGGRYDRIYHLAARIGVGSILEDPLRMLREHVEDIVHVCEWAKQFSATVVVASSSEVYGKSREVPFREDDTGCVIGSSTIPRWGYAVTKLYAEHVALRYAEQYGVPVVVVRLFNVAGYGQRAEGGCVVPIWADAVVRGKTIRVHGGGTQVRSFSHIADVVRGLIALGGCEASRPRGIVVNVGAPDGYIQMGSLASRMANYSDRFGKRSEIEQVPWSHLDPRAAEDEMTMRIPSTSRFEKLVGWRLEHRINDIIRDACQWALDKQDKNGTNGT